MSTLSLEDPAKMKHVIAVRDKLLEALEEEQTIRATADKHLKTQLETLKADMMDALQTINAALDRIDAPPDREQSPMLAQIQDQLDDLATRVDSLELAQRAAARSPR